MDYMLSQGFRNLSNLTNECLNFLETQKTARFKFFMQKAVKQRSHNSFDRLKGIKK